MLQSGNTSMVLETSRQSVQIISLSISLCLTVQEITRSSSRCSIVTKQILRLIHNGKNTSEKINPCPYIMGKERTNISSRGCPIWSSEQLPDCDPGSKYSSLYVIACVLLIKDLSHPFRRFFHLLASAELLSLDLD